MPYRFWWWSPSAAPRLCQRETSRILVCLRPYQLLFGCGHWRWAVCQASLRRVWGNVVVAVETCLRLAGRNCWWARSCADQLFFVGFLGQTSVIVIRFNWLQCWAFYGIFTQYLWFIFAWSKHENSLTVLKNCITLWKIPRHKIIGSDELQWCFCFIVQLAENRHHI